MARISLRTYHREIESLIDSGQIDEAIAHSRYILKFYPKCIDTYRLLGKAFLESQRYGDAADIFQRVLSSAPEDFVAHAGMSIIRQDEGHMDEALWHMERAFEMQPANSAIQEELRYLYGKRDGFEPPKIRLTRGALARMYAKGDLYPQAIGELRSALVDDPQRADLQVLLARVYLLSGQPAEAADAASNVLRKLPNCLEGNRIMVEALSSKGHADKAAAYFQRVQVLDPYSAHLSNTTPTPAKVPDMAVALEKLEWRPGTTAGQPTQPEWAASLGVQLEGMAPEKEILPNWLSYVEQTPGPVTPSAAALGAAAFVAAATPPFSPSTTAGPAPIEPTPDDTIPDWMRNAGWMAASGAAKREEEAAQADSVSASEAALNSGLVTGEIPEWLQTVAPAEVFEDASSETKPEAFSWLGEVLPAEPAAGGENGLMAWLGAGAAAAAAGLVSQADHQPPTPSAIETDSVTPTISEWLQGQAEQIQTETQADQAAANELPGWLRGSEQQVSSVESLPTPTDEVEQEGEVPDWLKELQPEISQTPKQGISPEAMATTAIAAAVEVPDWLKDLQPEADRPPPSEIPAEVASAKAAATESEVPDWLKDLLPETIQTPPAEIPTAAIAATAIAAEDEVPEWVKGLQPETAPEPATEIPEATVVEPAAPAAPFVQAESFDHVVDEQKPVVAGAPAAAEAGSGGIAAGAVAIGAAAAAFSKLTHHEDQPEPVEIAAPEIPPTPAPDLNDSDAAFAWLESLAVKQGAEEALLLKPEDRLEAPPDWVQEAQKSEETALAEISSIPPAAPTSLPDWLLENAPSEPPPAEPTSAEYTGAPFAELSTLPAWLKESAAEETLTVPTAEGSAELAALPDWLIESAPEEALAAPTAEEEAFPPVESVILLDWLLESEPEGTPAASQPEETVIPTAEPGALPDWLVEGVPAKLAASDIILKASDTEEGSTKPVEIGAQEDMAPPATKLAAAALVGAGVAAAALVGSQEKQEAPLAEGDTKPVSVSKPAPTRPEPELAPQTVAAPSGSLPPEVPAVPIQEETVTLPAEPAALPEWLLENPPTPEPTAAETLASVAAAGWISEAALETPPVVEEVAQDATVTPVPDEEETEAAFAWLESLAAKQGAEEALLLTPEERLETPPAWVQEAIQAGETALGPAGKGPGEAAAIAAAAGIVPEWLKEIETPTAPVEMVKIEAGSEETAPAEVLPELPPWLKDVEPEPSGVQPVEAEAWTPPLLETIHAQAPLDLNQASLAEMERLPGVGFILAQAIVEHRERFGPFKSVDDLQQVASLSPSTYADIREHFVVEAPVPATPAPLPETEPSFAGAARPAGAPLSAIDQARETLIQGDIPGAVSQYSALIKTRQSLPDVIRDLTEATYRYPVEAPIWQTLGDAYMRSDQLQEAMDAYTKAEEFLR